MSDTLIAKLTKRQREIVHLRCVECLTQDAVAHRICISPNTMRNHTTKILRKVGLPAMQGVCFEYGRWLQGQEAS